MRNAQKMLVAVLLFVSGFVLADDGLRDATSMELAAIKKGMETSLKDAQSARLKDVRIKGSLFCGVVNSKNSFGAYSGYTPFTGMIFDVEGKKVAAVMGLDSPKATFGLCYDKGIPLPPI